ncbi:low temperature requirement protein A [Agromyces atrinae]|uniref:Low temperature requirement protein LtrA n=1 Tax=Agromyces atrinae TaxID=592376 RepID=A0A852S4Z0_9MICO|nr:low temperature requirement protein A [Agromyces atrinae]NYD68378.1 low temperature requirement protein LtrA [Agromyces atrinae]
MSFIELFFDLVFVFALTQLSAYLYENQTPLGAFEGAIMVLALWWAWVSTTWVTNYLDPVKLPVRGAVIGLALIALMLSVSIADSFGERAWIFAIAYVALQLGRVVFVILATWRHDRTLARRFVRILVWTIVASTFWIGGALLPLEWQLPFWGVALTVEYLGSSLGFPVPGVASDRADDELSGAHIAERAALFVLIAIGEGLLVTGFTFVELEISVEAVLALFGAFVAAAAMWWIYFDRGERLGSEIIEKSDSPGRLARLAYTYVHLPVIAGIVLTSVADKELLSHPLEQSPSTVVAVLGGPALFLIGTLLFRRVLQHRWLVTYLAGILALGILAAASPTMTPIALGLSATAVLVAVAAAETIVRVRSGHRSGG